MNEQKLQMIHQAEKKAKEILMSIEEETQTITRNAHSEVVEIMEKTKIFVRENGQKILEDFQNQGHLEAQKILDDLDVTLTKLDHEAESKKKAVTDFLNEQVKVSYGNS